MNDVNKILLKKELQSLQELKNIGAKKVGEMKSKQQNVTNEIESLKIISNKIKALKCELLSLDTSNSGSSNDISPNSSYSTIFYDEKSNEVEVDFNETISSHKIINCIDLNVISDLENLEERAIVFPQMRYGWIAAWLETKKEKDNVFLIQIFQEDELIAVAWFSIDTRFGVKIVKECPVHWGDFYNFIIDKRYNTKRVSSAICDVLDTVKCDAILLKNINQRSSIYPLLKENSFKDELLCEVYSSLLVDVTEDNFYKRLSSKMRQSLRSKSKKIDLTYELTFEEHTDIEAYRENLPDIKNIFLKRWGYDLEDYLYNRREIGIKGILDSGTFRLFCLNLNGKLVAYRIGFVFCNVFYEWKSCHDPEYNRLSMGDIMTMYLQKHLVKNSIHAHNFMGGMYDYKKRWSTNELTTKNFLMCKSNSKVIGKAVVIYHLHVKAKLKQFISQISNFLRKE